MRRKKTDVEIVNSGGIYMFELLTEAARQWVKDNVSVESWQWLGGAFAVDHGYALDLAQGMLDAGLRVV